MRSRPSAGSRRGARVSRSRHAAARTDSGASDRHGRRTGDHRARRAGPHSARERRQESVVHDGSSRQLLRPGGHRHRREQDQLQQVQGQGGDGAEHRLPLRHNHAGLYPDELTHPAVRSREAGCAGVPLQPVRSPGECREWRDQERSAPRAAGQQLRAAL